MALLAMTMRLLVLLFLQNIHQARAAAVSNAACGDMNFTDNQEKHYGKADFIQHAALAETVGSLLAVFYDNGTWSITPQDLKEIVLSNIHAVEGTVIYGSVIAFEPNVWTDTTGLADGVPYPAASDACLNLSQEYCEISSENETSQRIDTLALTANGKTLYSPYAYHGSPEEKAFSNCSKATPEYCPSMDIAHLEDYFYPNQEWFNAPRCLYLNEGITTGYWTSPYFDEGAGKINMVTYSQPVIKDGEFLGITTIDIEVDALCYGNQCENACPAEEYNYTVSDCTGASGNRIVTYTTSDPSCPIDDGAVSSVSCAYVPVSSTIGIVSLVMGSLGAAICLGVMSLLFNKRQSALIKASQGNISFGFVFGALVANIGTFSLVGNPTNRCKLTFWALILPTTILLAFLLGKAYRVYKVFMAAKHFQRIQMTDRVLLMKICLVILVQIVLLIIWTFVEDTRASTRLSKESVDNRYCTGQDCFPTEEWCIQNHNNIVGVFSYIYLAILVVVGCVLSYQSRKLPSCFSEAKFVMFAMYNIAVMAILIGAVVVISGDDLSVAVRNLLLTFAIFFTATGSVLLVFLPKFLKIWTTSEEQIKRDLKSSTLRHTNVHSLAENIPVSYPRSTVPSSTASQYEHWRMESRAEDTNLASIAEVDSPVVIPRELAVSEHKSDGGEDGIDEENGIDKEFDIVETGIVSKEGDNSASPATERESEHEMDDGADRLDDGVHRIDGDDVGVSQRQEKSSPFVVKKIDALD